MRSLGQALKSKAVARASSSLVASSHMARHVLLLLRPTCIFVSVVQRLEKRHN